jgi:hypothetical protein
MTWYSSVMCNSRDYSSRCRDSRDCFSKFISWLWSWCIRPTLVSRSPILASFSFSLSYISVSFIFALVAWFFIYADNSSMCRLSCLDYSAYRLSTSCIRDFKIALYPYSALLMVLRLKIWVVMDELFTVALLVLKFFQDKFCTLLYADRFFQCWSLVLQLVVQWVELWN